MHLNRSGPLTTAIRALLLATPFSALMAVPGFTYPYVVPRVVFLRAAILLASAAVLLLVWRRSLRLQWRADPLAVALGIWLAVCALTALTGLAPWQSIYGDLERMGGVVTTGVLLLYYALLRSFFAEREWRWYFRITVGVGTVIAVFAAGAAWFPETGWPLHVTIGNTGLLGVYLLFHFGFAAAAVARESGPGRLGFAAALTPLGIGVVVSQNRSSLLGLLVGAFLGGALLLLRTPGKRRWLIPLAALPLLLLSIPAANRVRPELGLDRLPGVLGKVARAGAEGSSDGSRLVAWRAGLDAFADRPLLGHGPENYHLIWDEHGAAEAVRYVGFATFDRAHNAYIDVLATTGLVGGAAYLLLWAAVFLTLWRALRSGALRPTEAAVWLGLLTAYGVYLVFWFEDANSAPLWTATLAFLGSRASDAPLLALTPPGNRPLRRPLVVAGLVALAMSLYLHAFETGRVARILFRGGVPPEGWTVEDVLQEYRRAFDSAAPQTRDALAGYVAYLDLMAADFPAVRADPYRARVLDESFQAAFRFVETLQARDPRDHVLFVSDASLSILATRFYRTAEAYRRAAEKGARAVELAPNRLPPRFLLAEIHRLGGFTDLAKAQVDTALLLAGERGDARYYQAKVLESAGDVLAAGEALRRAAELGFIGGGLPASELMDTLSALGHHQAAADLGREHLEVRRGVWTSWWRAGPGALGAEEARVAERLPLAALRAGDTLLARYAAMRLAAADTTAAGAAPRFLADLANGRAEAWTLDPGRRTLSAPAAPPPPAGP